MENDCNNCKHKDLDESANPCSYCRSWFGSEMYNAPSNWVKMEGKSGKDNK